MAAVGVRNFRNLKHLKRSDASSSLFVRCPVQPFTEKERRLVCLAIFDGESPDSCSRNSPLENLRWRNCLCDPRALPVEPFLQGNSIRQMLTNTRITKRPFVA